MKLIMNQKYQWRSKFLSDSYQKEKEDGDNNDDNDEENDEEEDTFLYS